MDDLFDLIDDEEIVEVKKPIKKEVKKEKTVITESEKSSDVKEKYKYPFIMHYAGQNIDISHIFEHGHEYTSDEITKAMLNHQYYQFSAKVTYDYIAADNVLVPIFQYHKKG